LHWLPDAGVVVLAVLLYSGIAAGYTIKIQTVLYILILSILITGCLENNDELQKTYKSEALAKTTLDEYLP